VKTYPFVEADLFIGPPAETNFSYGYSKRLLHVLILAYRKQYGVAYSTFSPSNVYGPGDHFDSEASHFISALISKASALKDDDTLELWGTGEPLRQQLYVDDLCKIIPILLEKHNSDIPLIVAPHENLTIDMMTRTLMHLLNKENKIVYNKFLDGQYRKDGSNKELLNLIGNFEFTPFRDGIMKVFKWYNEQRVCEK
jgi:GDP-L-fucose synthase